MSSLELPSVTALAEPSDIVSPVSQSVSRMLRKSFLDREYEYRRIGRAHVFALKPARYFEREDRRMEFETLPR